MYKQVVATSQQVEAVNLLMLPMQENTSNG